MNDTAPAPQYKKSACILCSINCGLEIQVGGEDGRELLKVRGDKSHVSSRGYLCNKAARLNHYQSGADRLDTPMRRRPDGSYEPVDWDTAIAEVARGLKRVRDAHGGDKIYLIGGGGQGNHLGTLYVRSLAKALRSRYETNALAQEKTGEFWVGSKMFGGSAPHGDFHNAEVAVFVGKNPWQSHGFPQARKTLRAIANDPKRSMVVLDPSLTDTAKIADYHLRVRPGGDAWCLSAMIATVVQEGLYDAAFVEAHTDGFAKMRPHFSALDIGEHARICDVDEELIRAAARRIATADSASVMEDLGVQQNINSTLMSYLQRILWVICGHFAKPGCQNIAVQLQSIAGSDRSRTAAKPGAKNYKRSPVLGRKVIAGLLPCNEVPDEILTDHPERFRAAIVQSCNPVHSFADAPRMRKAMEALEFSVVIDVAMTETARTADYVLPTSSQFEKHECTFFPIEFPDNFFHLRHPIAAPLPGTLPEAEIHTRLLEALDERGLIQAAAEQLNAALKEGRKAFFDTAMQQIAGSPEMLAIAPALLYRTLGKTLDGGRMAEAAPFWALCHQFAAANPQYAAAAGFDGTAFEAGEAMFAKLLASPSGFVFSSSGADYSDSWQRVGYPDKRIRLHIEELFGKACALDESLLEQAPEYPFILSAGNRRATTTNTIVRDPSWDAKGKAECLRISPRDAAELGLADGGKVRVTTATGSGTTVVEVHESQRDGTIELPNGLGLEYTDRSGRKWQVGLAPNEFTCGQSKDFFAATPWHKRVPAQLEKVA